jgi:hypothetical protein
VTSPLGRRAVWGLDLMGSATTLSPGGEPERALGGVAAVTPAAHGSVANSRIGDRLLRPYTRRRHLGGDRGPFFFPLNTRAQHEHAVELTKYSMMRFAIADSSP